MEKSDVIESLLENARRNDASGAVVVNVPPEVLRDAGATYGDEDEGEGGARVETTLVAGPVAEEDDDAVVLKSPSRVGQKEDFSPEVRKRLRAEGVYGFRDGNLDGVRLSKEKVTVHRVD
jgi:hypothetical protein